MAMSNWDTLAFDNDGKSCGGIFKSENDDCLEIYKNWVYIRSERMWAEGCGYTKPTIAEVREGDLRIAGFGIHAKRGPQSAIFVSADVYDFKNKEYKFFGGIGCYGFIDRIGKILKDLGREGDISEDWFDGSEINDSITICLIQNFKTGERIIYHDSSKDGEYDASEDWIGVLPSTLNEFFKWLETLKEDHVESFAKWIEKCKNADALRYNQGDAFFASNTGNEVPCSEVGKSKSPMIFKMLKGASDNVH